MDEKLLGSVISQAALLVTLAPRTLVALDLERELKVPIITLKRGKRLM